MTRVERGAVFAGTAVLLIAASCSSSPFRAWKEEFDAVVRALERIPVSSGGVPVDLELFYEKSENLHRTAREWGYGRDLVRDLALTSDSPAVRAACLRSLARTGTGNDVSILIHALEDPAVFVADTAYAGLKKCTGKDFGRKAGRWLQWWRSKEKNHEKNE